MKRIILLSIYSVFSMISLYAQPQLDFAYWAKYVKKSYDITVKIPRGYACERSQPFFTFFPNNEQQYGKNKRVKRTVTAYHAIAASKDGNSKIFYPSPTILHDFYKRYCEKTSSTLEIFTRNSYLTELHNTVYGGFESRENIKCQSEWTSYVQKIDGEKAKEWGNSDVVFIVDFPEKEACESKFSHCIGLYMIKETYIPLFLKVVLTDEGYVQRDVLLMKAAQSMSFGKSLWKDNEVERLAELRKYQEKNIRLDK